MMTTGMTADAGAAARDRLEAELGERSLRRMHRDDTIRRIRQDEDGALAANTASETACWYVAAVHPGHEQATEAALKAIGAEALVPMRQGKRRRRRGRLLPPQDEVLMTGYVLVRFVSTAKALRGLLRQEHVTATRNDGEDAEGNVGGRLGDVVDLADILMNVTGVPVCRQRVAPAVEGRFNVEERIDTGPDTGNVGRIVAAHRRIYVFEILERLAFLVTGERGVAFRGMRITVGWIEWHASFSSCWFQGIVFLSRPSFCRPRWAFQAMSVQVTARSCLRVAQPQTRFSITAKTA
ncbi:transcription termination/antitermination NusG family protein [Martelella soudanensis]|uniref:transcription termination/antitermination NusG family protein n=1 Tax=unclassified Martelella TaxID=2629616 RepID=UPI0015DD5A29|nr:MULTISPECIES: transcription termination/antitermination NusG family protein [unclassified Martelella]